MAESTQHKLDRVRPPRVQITYDVEIGNAIEKRNCLWWSEFWLTSPASHLNHWQN